MRSHTWMGALLGLALALTVPAAALAEHDRHARGYDGDRRVRVHGPYCESNSRHAHHRRHHRAAPRYACRPCGQHFGSYRVLRRHVHQHHHVPFWRVPFLLFAHAFGHVTFYG